jgi:hypothetical protein
MEAWQHTKEQQAYRVLASLMIVGMTVGGITLFAANCMEKHWQFAQKGMDAAQQMACSRVDTDCMPRGTFQAEKTRWHQLL